MHRESKQYFRKVGAMVLCIDEIAQELKPLLQLLRGRRYMYYIPRLLGSRSDYFMIGLG